MDDQPIFVSADIENEAILAYEVHTCPKLELDLRGTSPLRSGHNGKPRAERTLRLRMTLPELLQGSASNHSHRAKVAVTSLVASTSAEIEVAAVVGEQDVVVIEAVVATPPHGLCRRPRGAAAGELRLVDEEVDPLLADAEA